MTAINKWRVYCKTESKFVEGYLDYKLICTTCFNNNTHTVNSNSINIVTAGNFREEKNAAGNFRAEKNAAGPKEGVITTTKPKATFNNNLNILSFSVQISDTSKGDIIECVVLPVLNIDTLSSEVTATTTVITLSGFIISKIGIGYQLVFTNPVTGFVEKTPEILSINTTNNTVTLICGLVNTFPSGSYIKFQKKYFFGI